MKNKSTIDIFSFCLIITLFLINTLFLIFYDKSLYNYEIVNITIDFFSKYFHNIDIFAILSQREGGDYFYINAALSLTIINIIMGFVVSIYVFYKVYKCSLENIDCKYISKDEKLVKDKKYFARNGAFFILVVGLYLILEVFLLGNIFNLELTSRAISRFLFIKKFTLLFSSTFFSVGIILVSSMLIFETINFFRHKDVYIKPRKENIKKYKKKKGFLYFIPYIIFLPILLFILWV